MHLLLRETCILAAGAQQAGALRRLELGANPVGGVAAPLLLALTVSPPSGRGPEDPPRPSISVSLRECELSAKDAKLKFDWLHAIPVVATRTQNHRAPWRFRFHLDDPLERALCEETLRLTAADSGGVFRFVAVNVCAGNNQWNALSRKNFKPLQLGHIEVDSADFWTDHLLSASSL